VPERIRQLDMGAVERILELDREGFGRYVAETGATICGRVAIDVLLGMLGSGSRAELVAYDTSGRMTGDWNHSVSYASISFAPANGAA
jgi:AmmeMemoRadiSam system protein B